MGADRSDQVGQCPARLWSSSRNHDLATVGDEHPSARLRRGGGIRGVATAARIDHPNRSLPCRDILIHGYDLLDHELVLTTAENQVPKLLAEVEALLAEGGSDDPPRTTKP